MNEQILSDEMLWWLVEPDVDREIIGLVRKLTPNQQNQSVKRLTNLSWQIPIFESTQSPPLYQVYPE
jgi:hypothetical protein|tara:strand:- start:674 stop:874 length:201 start_codon:yes stop_codon:yes gene_type:complete